VSGKFMVEPRQRINGWVDQPAISTKVGTHTPSHRASLTTLITPASGGIGQVAVLRQSLAPSAQALQRITIASELISLRIFSPSKPEATVNLVHRVARFGAIGRERASRGVATVVCPVGASTESQRCGERGEYAYNQAANDACMNLLHFKAF
jgi:hypothetical protein